VPKSYSDKKADSSTEQLLLTLMEEVKGRQPMMCSEEDLMISAISICLGVLFIFTITWTTWECLMKRLMMDSSLVTLKWPKHSGCSTSEDKKWKKQYMLLSVKMMKLFLNPAQKDFVSPEKPPEFTSVDNHPALSKLKHLESADDLEPVGFEDTIINEPINEV
nr:hypothetical protein [Tanacetum cinerariifolium]